MFPQNVRSFFRQMLRTPGLSASVVLTLALGAAAVAVMFSVTYSVLLRPLPYVDSHELALLQSRLPSGELASVSLPNFRDWKAQSRSFTTMAAYTIQSSSLQSAGAVPMRVDAVVTTANLLTLLGVSPALGRGFMADADQPGAPCSVVLSASVWSTHFANDPSVPGKPVLLDGRPCTVVGVMPRSFRFPDQSDNTIWTELRPTPNLENRGTTFLTVIGRLKSGTTLDTAQSELALLGQQLAQAYPNENKGVSIQAKSYQDAVTGDIRLALWGLIAVVIVVQLIICANVANMQLIRAIGRRKEMAIRTALGAGTSRLVSQLLVESSLLAIVGAGIGLPVAWQAIEVLKRTATGVIPRVEEVELYPVVCLALFVASMITAVLFGLAPIFYILKQDVEKVLRESARAVKGSRGQQYSRDVLVAAQLALAVVLVTASVVLLRSLYVMLNQDLGLDARNVLTMQTSVLADSHAGQNLMATLYGPQLERIRRLPGVTSAGLVTFLPLGAGHATANFIPVGQPSPDPQRPPQAALNAASEQYFEALRIPVITGRVFTSQDDLQSFRVAVINDTLAQRYFANQDPVGKQIAFNDPDFKAHPLTIIGVVRGNRQQKLTADPEPEIYFSMRQVPPDTIWAQFLQRNLATYVVRTERSPELSTRPVQGVIHEVDPNQVLFNVRTMEDVISHFVRDRRLGLILLSVFAGLALVVATSGLYAMLSYMVQQRTADIAIRMALGAMPGDMIQMVAGRAMVLNAAGFAIGTVCAIASGQIVSTLLYGVRTWDWATLGATCLVLLLVTLPATWLPAYRAVRVNPLEALRSE